MFYQKLIRILLIEDDEDDYFLTQDLLSEIQDVEFVIDWVNSYEEGITAMCSGVHDICLLDFRLGGRSGLNLLRETTRQRCDMPVIVLTGQDDRMTDLESMKAGAADYLVKDRLDGQTLERSIRYTLEHHRLEKALRLSEQRTRSVIEKTPVGICITDEHGYFEFVNSAFCTIYGFSADELMDRHFTLVVPDDQKQMLSELHDQFIREGTETNIRGEWKVQTKDNRLLTILADAVRITGRDNRPKKVTYVVDITRRKEMEQELQQAKDAAENASLAKSEFLASMSHEIRTPMNSIIGMTEISLQTGLTDEQRDYLQTVRDSGEHLLNVINDILDLSKIEARKLALDTVHFNLFRTLQSTVNTFRLQARRKKIDLDLTIHPDVPRYLQGDPIRLRQIVVNLVGNAIKFTDTGGVRIEVRPEQNGDDTPGSIYLRFQVIDTGVGIPPEQQTMVFDEFSQVSCTPARRCGGTGLGLAISQRLVRLMNGTIGLESTPGTGSIFFFTARFLPGDPDQVDSARWDMTDSLPEIPPLHILLAEDNELNLKMATILLEQMGHRVTPARHGEAVLDRLQKERFDLVLMDLEMPRMGGLETTRRIRRGEAGAANRSMTIIAMTAHAMTSHREKSEAAGMNGYIVKPIRPRSLVTVLKQQLPDRPPSSDGPAVPTPVPDEAVFGRKEFMNRIGGNAELCRELVAFFLTQMPTHLDNLKDALAQQETARLRSEAHAVKGMSANISAYRLAETARRLEKTAAAADWEAIPALLETLQTEFDRFQEAAAADDTAP